MICEVTGLLQAPIIPATVLDRIFEPAEIARLHLENHSKSTLPDLKCSKCETLIATPMLYEPEGRLALRLIRGTYIKKKHAQ